MEQNSKSAFDLFLSAMDMAMKKDQQSSTSDSRESPPTKHIPRSSPHLTSTTSTASPYTISLSTPMMQFNAQHSLFAHSLQTHERQMQLQIPQMLQNVLVGVQQPMANAFPLPHQQMPTLSLQTFATLPLQTPLHVDCEKDTSPNKHWSKPQFWTQEEDDLLTEAVEMYGAKGWRLVSEYLGNKRTPDQCCQRWHRVLSPSINHNEWTREEDDTLLEGVRVHGEGSWREVSRPLLGRTGQQCRYRWRHLKRIQMTMGRRRGGAIRREKPKEESSSSAGAEAAADLAADSPEEQRGGSTSNRMSLDWLLN